MKSRQIQKRKIVVDEKTYVYSVIEYFDETLIRVYLEKSPFVLLHISYAESWGIEPFRPRTVGLLIRHALLSGLDVNESNNLWLFEEMELFQTICDEYFAEKDPEELERFLEHYQKFPHPKASYLRHLQN